MMNLENLVEISSNNNQVVTDSLVVAKVFGKRHDNVIRDIKGLLKNEDTKKCSIHLLILKNRISKDILNII